MQVCRKYVGTYIVIAFSLIYLTTISAAPPVGSTVQVQSKDGGACVILPYDFDVAEENFPELNLPDNALLVLEVEGVRFRPEKFSTVQGGKKYLPVGMFGYYFWGSFFAIYFDVDFNKFKPFEAKIGDDGVTVTAEAISKLKGKARPAGQRAWEEPVTDADILNAHPLELPALLSRGRLQEYADEALWLRGKGGLALVRAESLQALDDKDYIRAAVLAGQALKWSPALDPPEIRPIANYQDWITVARAFKEMGQPLAAVRAYEQALKIRRDRDISHELKELLSSLKKDGGGTTGVYHESFSEAELALEPHGQIPIPPEERNVIREGISANGVFLGDHKELILAQCGKPEEEFSGMLFYPDHPVCPMAVFLSPRGRAYSIRTVRGKSVKGISVGSSVKRAVKVYGKPDRKETNPMGPDNKPSVRWIYLKEKIAFVDYDNNGRIDAIDVFDYQVIR